MEIATLNQNDEDDVEELEQLRYVLSKTKRLYRDLFDSLFHEFIKRKWDVTILPHLQIYLKNVEPVKEITKDKLSNKQQVLLLHKLGVFNIQAIKNLTDIQKGKLFGHLLNRNDDNTENYIRYREGINVDRKYSLSLPKVEDKVLQLLKELGIDKV
jgi:hypothetical protein